VLQHDVEVFNVAAMLEEIKRANCITRFWDLLLYSKIFLSELRKEYHWIIFPDEYIPHATVANDGFPLRIFSCDSV
jgi:hypothetical protein